MWKDFKEFAFKGNVIDLAVAVVIGAAFGKIVSSLVENIITPLMGIITGKVDVSGLHKEFGEADITYGLFIQSIIDFFIVAFFIFIVIRLLTKTKSKEEVKEQVEAQSIDTKEELLKEIRDLLKNEQKLPDEK